MEERVRFSSSFSGLGALPSAEPIVFSSSSSALANSLLGVLVFREDGRLREQKMLAIGVPLLLVRAAPRRLVPN
jgi:hypothetical protein